VRGLLIGRFQPFHRGHLGLVRAIVRDRPEAGLIIGIGSADQSYTWENPFTAGERFEMIAAALEEARLERIVVVPIPDLHRHALWVRHIEALLPAFDRVYTNNPLTRALFERAGYSVESPPLIDRRRFEAARIRARLASGLSVRDRVPPATARYLAAIRAASRLRMLRPAASAERRGSAR
jgi:nicotinamide-nucleotide adenylyltransferase